jgi:hypothetical protein
MILYLPGMRMLLMRFWLGVLILAVVHSSTAQDSPLHSYYNELSKELGLTAREDKMGENFVVVFYPNGIMRDRYQLTGLIATSPELETIWVSFTIPTEGLSLDVDETDLVEIQSHFSPWSITWSPSSVDSTILFKGSMELNPDVPADLVGSLIFSTMESLESLFDQHLSSATGLDVSSQCQSLLDAIGIQAAGLHPLSLDMLCSCADWHYEKGYVLEQFWFECALYSYVVLDPLTPQPMVTCRQPECQIPLKRKGDHFLVELEFPSGEKEEAMLFIEDVYIMLNDNQLMPVIEAEGWTPSDLHRPEHTLSLEADKEVVYNHYRLPSFKVGDVTFSSQSVLVPKSGKCRPYFSAGLLSTLGRWELDADNAVLRITPWAYVVEK